jgi:hypothetical protein
MKSVCIRLKLYDIPRGAGSRLAALEGEDDGIVYVTLAAAARWLDNNQMTL